MCFLHFLEAVATCTQVNRVWPCLRLIFFKTCTHTLNTGLILQSWCFRLNRPRPVRPFINWPISKPFQNIFYLWINIIFTVAFFKLFNRRNWLFCRTYCLVDTNLTRSRMLFLKIKLRFRISPYIRFWIMLSYIYY